MSAGITVRWGRQSLAVNKPAAGNAAGFCPSPGAVDEAEEWMIFPLTLGTDQYTIK